MPSRKPDQKDWMYLSWQAGIFASFCQVYWAKLSCLAAAHGLRAHDDHFPKPNRKSCKIYEILRILQGKCLCNAKSRTRDTQCMPSPWFLWNGGIGLQKIYLCCKLATFRKTAWLTIIYTATHSTLTRIYMQT